MKDNQKEWNLILQTCKAALLENIELSNEDVDFQNIDWQMFKRMAQYHKVRPLIYKGITRLNLHNEFPKSYINELSDLSKNIAYRNFENAKELIRLSQLLDKEGIDFIPFKGVVLSQLAYGDIGIRESSDIDILIKLSDFEKIQRLLLNEGYTEELKIPRWLKSTYFRLYCEFNFDLYNQSGTRLFHVEPHWYTGSKMFQTDFDYDQIVKFTDQKNVFGQEFKILSSEGLLITTAIHHGYSDRWRYLKNMADIMAIINPIKENADWMLVFEICDELKITNLLLPGLVMSHRCFDIDLPKEVLDRCTKRLTSWSKKQLIGFESAPNRKNSTYDFVSRIIYHLKIRAHFSTKFLIIYYHVIHVLFRPFIRKGV